MEEDVIDLDGTLTPVATMVLEQFHHSEQGWVRRVTPVDAPDKFFWQVYEKVDDYDPSIHPQDYYWRTVSHVRDKPLNDGLQLECAYTKMLRKGRRLVKDP